MQREGVTNLIVGQKLEKQLSWVWLAGIVGRRKFPA